MCYNIRCCRPSDRTGQPALYLFPTKALSADQVAELYELVTLLDVDIKTYTYDGDTRPGAARAIRQAGTWW